METNSYDTVNHPPHYIAHDIHINCPCGLIRNIECIDITRNFNFNLGNAIKYIWRADFKGKHTEDLQKAIWYLNDEIKIKNSKSLHICSKCFTGFNSKKVFKEHESKCINNYCNNE